MQGRLRKGYTPEQAFGFRLPPFLVEIEFLINETTLLFLLVLLNAHIFGQNVYIPDVYFKAFLTSGNWIDTNNDNEIQFSEAAAFDGVMDCSFGNISLIAVPP